MMISMWRLDSWLISVINWYINFIFHQQSWSSKVLNFIFLNSRRRRHLRPNKVMQYCYSFWQTTQSMWCVYMLIIEFNINFIITEKWKSTKQKANSVAIVCNTHVQIYVDVLLVVWLFFGVVIQCCHCDKLSVLEFCDSNCVYYYINF